MATRWESLRVESNTNNPGDMALFVAEPEGEETAPAIIVVQEVWGVNAHIQNIAVELSKKGYVAVAPALYHREGGNPILTYGPEDVDTRAKYRENLDDDHFILDINTVVEWLNNNQRIIGQKIGIMGFCLGGRVSYLAASSCPGIDAAVVFYGGFIKESFGNGRTPFARTADIQCPIMGNFGEDDQNPSVEVVREIESKLKENGKEYDFKIYSSAGHGFMADRPSFHEASAIDAWNRTTIWFDKYIVNS